MRTALSRYVLPLKADVDACEHIIVVRPCGAPDDEWPTLFILAPRPGARTNAKTWPGQLPWRRRRRAAASAGAGSSRSRSGHLRRLLDAQQGEDGRREVAEPAALWGHAGVRTVDPERHRVGGVRGVRAAVGLDHVLAVAVVGGDAEQAPPRRDGGDERPMQASTVSMPRTAAATTPVWPTMSALAKLTTRSRTGPRSSRADHGVADAGGAHLGRLVVGGDVAAARAPARRSSPSNGSSRPPLKKNVTCAYFSVSATCSWRQAVLGEALGSTWRMVRRERDRQRELRLVAGHGDEVDGTAGRRRGRSRRSPAR